MHYQDEAHEAQRTLEMDLCYAIQSAIVEQNHETLRKLLDLLWSITEPRYSHVKPYASARNGDGCTPR